MADQRQQVSLVTAFAVIGEGLKLYKEYDGIQNKTIADQLAFVGAVVKLLNQHNVTLQDLSEILVAVQPFLGMIKGI